MANTWSSHFNLMFVGLLSSTMCMSHSMSTNTRWHMKKYYSFFSLTLHSSETFLSLSGIFYWPHGKLFASTQFDAIICWNLISVQIECMQLHYLIIVPAVSPCYIDNMLINCNGYGEYHCNKMKNLNQQM